MVVTYDVRRQRPQERSFQPPENHDDCDGHGTLRLDSIDDKCRNGKRVAIDDKLTTHL